MAQAQSSLSNDGNPQIAAQPSREQLEAALLAAEARVAALEQQLTTVKQSAQRQQSQLTALVENLRIGILLVSEEGQILFVNQYFRELFGLAVGDVVAEVYPPIPPDTVYIDEAFQDPADFAARAQALHIAGKTVLNEEFILANGRVLELDYLVLDQDQAGRLICYRDVTERHERDTLLRTLSYIPEQNPDPILRLAYDGEIIYANPAATSLVQACDTYELVREQLLGFVQDAVATSKVYRQELVLAEQHYLVTIVGVPNERLVTLYMTDITARYQAEQQVAEQRAFYENILAHVPAAVAVVDADFRYRFVNAAVEPDPVAREWMLGKTNEEACRYRSMPREISERRQQMFAQVITSRQELQWEEALLGGPTPRHLLRHLCPIVEADGSVRLLVGSGIDITARKLAEEKAAQQQEFYESILNLLPVDIAVFDAEHRYLFVNPSSITNPEIRQWIIGKTNAEYCAFRQRPARLGQQREEFFNQAIQARTDVLWEEMQGNAETQRRILRHLRPVFNSDGTLRLVVGSGLDITARYAAEERQRQSEELIREQQTFIRLIVDTLPNIVYVTDQFGNVSFANKVFEEMAAVSEHVAVGEKSPAVVEQLRQIQQCRQQVFTTQKPLVTEMSLTLKSGETRSLQVHMNPLERINGHQEVLIMSTDITALKKTQQLAEESARAKESFLTRMSHEIRTPLNGVLGMAKLLERTELAASQREYLQTMQRAGQHLLALVNDVLDMAKITANHLQLDHAPFDLSVALHGALQTVASLAEQKGLALRVIPFDLADTHVLGDAYRLHQVLLNLLSNAIKFTEQGSVELGTTVVADTPSALAVRFWVKDTGIGIAPEQQIHIFEAFMQANAHTSQRFGGTGLGLAISEQLIHHMGGTLQLCSELGKGTTFSFVLTFPRVVEETLSATSAPAVDYEQLRGLRILLAEDNMVNQWLATVMLEHWGVQVEAVGDGQQALNLLRANAYDVAILDIQMPGLSGVGVTRAIRQYDDAARAHVPIIALTANAFADDGEAYLAAGMNAWLTKPFEEAELCELILRLAKPSV
ncbi:PAS domain-containing protein [Hymenobacter sp. GOD-10R]|uniref:PAS domain-containing protein n=1 Tax=Hymenobacter sp. GOD-10R TaxID=3093922 RepID=UPI002D78CF37|nr:PAS domain-containing protein [Hymenobacter sp. GOD-10R]WRQ27061.1 PAS domain-containing protein [Hymenobacter sp. GOD-10R]